MPFLERGIYKKRDNLIPDVSRQPASDPSQNQVGVETVRMDQSLAHLDVFFRGRHIVPQVGMRPPVVGHRPMLRDVLDDPIHVSDTSPCIGFQQQNGMGTIFNQDLDNHPDHVHGIHIGHSIRHGLVIIRENMKIIHLFGRVWMVEFHRRFKESQEVIDTR